MADVFPWDEDRGPVPSPSTSQICIDWDRGATPHLLKGHSCHLGANFPT